MFRQFSVFCGLIYLAGAITLSAFTTNFQQGQAAPAKSDPVIQTAAAKGELAPKLKPEDVIAIQKIQKKYLGDQVQIDRIAQAAQSQIGKYQQEMQALSKELAEATDKAMLAAGADKSKWQLNGESLELTPIPPPKLPEPKKPK